MRRQRPLLTATPLRHVAGLAPGVLQGPAPMGMVRMESLGNTKGAHLPTAVVGGHLPVARPTRPLLVQF